MTSSVAQTILQQLGGTTLFGIMTGATKTTPHPNGLSFRLPRNAANTTNINFVRITLNNDLYDIAFERWDWEAGRKLFSREVTGIGDENLRQTFTHYTGLHTSP